MTYVLSEKAKQLFQDYPMDAPPREKPVYDPLTLVASDLKSVVVLAPGEVPEATDVPPTEKENEEFKLALLNRVLQFQVPVTEEDKEARRVALEKMDEESAKEEALHVDMTQKFKEAVLARMAPPVAPEELTKLDTDLSPLFEGIPTPSRLPTSAAIEEVFDEDPNTGYMMAFNDGNCTCNSYCECGRYNPCGCTGMARDPHCEECCEHLTPEHEARWREEEENESIGPY
jgi:hypothetical protein